MKRFIGILCTLYFVTSSLYAQTSFEQANAAYAEGRYEEAATLYQAMIDEQPNATLYYNLAFAQSKITDNIEEQNFFLSTWARAVRNGLSERTWLILSVCLFVLALTGLLIFLLGRELWLRKTAFHVAWIALLFSLVSGLNAWSLHQRDTLRNEAIITQGVVNAKSSPDRSGTDLFTVHEGTKVTIRETLGEWANIHVGNNEGWIRLSNLERI